MFWYDSSSMLMIFKKLFNLNYSKHTCSTLIDQNLKMDLKTWILIFRTPSPRNTLDRCLSALLAGFMWALLAGACEHFWPGSWEHFWKVPESTPGRFLGALLARFLLIWKHLSSNIGKVFPTASIYSFSNVFRYTRISHKEGLFATLYIMLYVRKFGLKGCSMLEYICAQVCVCVCVIGLLKDFQRTVDI